MIFKLCSYGIEKWMIFKWDSIYYRLWIYHSWIWHGIAHNMKQRQLIIITITIIITIMSVFYSANFKLWLLALLETAYAIRQTLDTRWHLKKYTQYNKMFKVLLKLWTQKKTPTSPDKWAMECLFWVLWRNYVTRYGECTVYVFF